MDIKPVIFGIDTGNANTKTKNHCFYSKLIKYDDRTDADAATSKFLKYDDAYYAISSRRPTHHEDDKRKNEYLMPQIMFSLAKEINERGLDPSDVNAILALGLPPGYFKEKNRKELAKFILENNELHFSVGKIDYNVNIVDCDVWLQGYGAVAVAKDFKIGENRNFIMLDAGGGTTDIMRFTQGEPDWESKVSLKDGMIQRMNQIQTIVGEDSFGELDVDTIYEILDNPEMKDAYNVRNIADGIFRDYANNIVGEMRERQMSVTTAPIVLVGGGSRYIKNYLEADERVFKVYCEPEIKANARGYEEFSKLKRGYTEA